ncbi:hypothetical protein MVA48_14555 [Blastococcus sp. PRF04-17]|nr:hypothetical protein MVA48_14555 [Blastococcus sp. PRF04-17]
MRSLLSSLEDQTHQRFVVAICAQGEFASMEALVGEFASRGLDLRLVSSARGAARGRNVAEAALPGTLDVLLFPNDTTVFHPDSLDQINQQLGEAKAGCVTVVDRFGDRLRVPARGTRLNRHNVWSIILPAMVVRQSIFRDLGGFDETLGTGAATPWQSGEETDFFLRYLLRYGTEGFAWLPEVRIGGLSDAEGLSRLERRRKLRGYARGYGRILRMHRYGVAWSLRALAAGATFSLRHRGEYQALDGVAVLVGRLEGLLGLTFARPTEVAVER